MLLIWQRGLEKGLKNALEQLHAGKTLKRVNNQSSKYDLFILLFLWKQYNVMAMSIHHRHRLSGFLVKL